ncbi:hypothetical protein K7X08_019733 [Anisodus acutangulus]|uniref:Uncharacterized protein n=1 Tax=Anisodus acutangulus TaxID=402998 RepID=A0A9Q1RQ12_9SOLA|nr:hypothetical protein K7X08_019733 [Anisodus acutangulus]
MSFKSIVCKLREMKDGKGAERKHRSNSSRSQIVPHVALSDPIEQGQWANLPPKVLLDIIRRVEESEPSWPARSVIVSCASVCKSWRKITKEIVKIPEECGRLTFPISLKPLKMRGKLLLATKKIRRATSRDFVISLVADDFSRASNTYAGKLRSNFLGTKFSIYDSQPPSDAAIQQPGPVATISYELNEGGSAPTSISFPQSFDDKSFSAPLSKAKESAIDSSGFSKSAVTVTSQEPHVLKNKAPRWHEQLQC